MLEFKKVLPILFIFFLAIFTSLPLTQLQAQKINGVNFVGTPSPVDADAFQPLLDIGANHVCFVPFAYLSNDSPDLIWSGLDWQWWGESLKGIEECVKLAQMKGLKTIVKPQVWIKHGSFTGELEFDREKDWQILESGYTEYLLSFAKLCEEYNVEILCIGTELCRFTKIRADYWAELISKVRNVYNGKLTYAANWDSFERFPHWEHLDYIGVDAYFPLDNKSTPQLQSLITAWNDHYLRLKKLSSQQDKQVLFTEYGYRSVDHCTREPWSSERGGKVNHEAQHNAYQALFARFWDEDWFAGGLLWKWYPKHQEAGGLSDNRFTPQNKPAQRIIRSWYRRY